MNITKNKNILSKITLNKRILKELLDLTKNHNTNIIINDKSLILNINKYKFDKITINESFDEVQQIDFINKNIKISFLLTSFYPFNPPKNIYVNNYDYIQLLHFSHKDLRHLGFNNTCLCCNSLSCTNNWSPGLRFNLLLDEIIKNMELKQFNFYYKFIKIIEKKYLIDDISLLKYFYS